MGIKGTARGAAAPVARRSRRDAGAAAAVLALASVAFLWVPLTSGGIYGPGDHTQATEMLRVAPEGYRPANPELTDPAVQYLPWLDWNRAELAEGRLPLWNPYNGSGSPHLANGQSAVFSAFSVPYYVLPMRWAPVVAAFLQLMVAGMLTYGLLRHLRRSFLAGVVGALGFAFCAASVLFLSWPLSDAAALVPGTVWATSALVTAADGRQRCRAAAGLAVTVALGLLAGHVETTFVGVLLAGGLALGRVAARHRHRWPGAVRPAAWLLGAGALGALVAAIALLPQLEYIRHSAAVDVRGQQDVVADHPLAMHVFPLVVGLPGQRFTGDGAATVTLLDQGGPYVGGTILALGAVGVAWAAWRRRPLPGFFALAGLAVLVDVYDVAGVGALVADLPVLELLSAHRLLVAWQLCLVVLAAFGLDALVRAGRALASRPARDRLVSVGALATGAGAFIAVGVWLARDMRGHHLRPGAGGLPASNGHIAFVVAGLVAGFAGMGLLLLRPHRRITALAGGLVVGAVALQGPILLRDVNPTVDADHFFPESAASRALADATGGEQTLWLDGAALFPDMNLWYRLRSPDTYDALVVRSYDELYREVLRPPRIVLGGMPLGVLTGPASPQGVGNLRALGIRHVVAGSGFPFGEVAARGRGRAGDGGRGAFVLQSTGEPFETVVAEGVDTGLDTGGPGRCHLAIADRSTGAPLRTARAPCTGGAAAFSFPRLSTPAGRELAVTVTPPAAPPGGRVSRPGSATATAAAGPPSLAAYATPVPELELAAVVEGFRVYRVPGGPPRYFSPAAVTGDKSRGRSPAFDPAFDPLATSVVDAAGVDPGDIDASDADAGTPGAAAGTPGAAGGTPGPDARPGTVEVLAETPTSIRLRVDRPDPGWLIALQTRFPGWRARVDGSSVPIEAANVAFMGVRVPAGESVVELTYEPPSVRAGAVGSVAGVGGVVALAVLGRRRRVTCPGSPVSGAEPPRPPQVAAHRERGRDEGQRDEERLAGDQAEHDDPDGEDGGGGADAQRAPPDERLDDLVHAVEEAGTPAPASAPARAPAWPWPRCVAGAGGHPGISRLEKYGSVNGNSSTTQRRSAS